MGANGAEGRNRTGTVITHRRILSPVRLPVPPPRHGMWIRFFNLGNLLISLTSGKRGSNPRPPPWQGGALPLSYFRKMVPAKGVEPSTL